MDNEAAFAHIARLIESMPKFDSDGKHLTPHELQWIGRAHAIVVSCVGPNAGSAFSHHASILNIAVSNRGSDARTIAQILYKALAKVELLVSPQTQGAFIAANNVFDAMATLSNVFQAATSEIMIVDPYMDANALFDFAVLVPDRCSIRLLTDEKDMKAGLEPAVRKWIAQYGASRPLEARKASKRVLHDRVVLADGKDAWILTQSLNAFATRAPASIARADPETASLKVDAYERIWSASTSI